MAKDNLYISLYEVFNVTFVYNKLTAIDSVFAGAMIYMRKSAGGGVKNTWGISAHSGLWLVCGLISKKILGCNLVF